MVSTTALRREAGKLAIQQRRHFRFRRKRGVTFIFFHLRYKNTPMGIKGLTKLLAANAPMSMKEQKLESYSGCAIAIDASISIYQFLAVVGRQGTDLLTNEAGEVTSHLQGMFTRTIRLLEAGLIPVYVFDGKPSDLKKQALAKRHSERMDAAEDLKAAIEIGDKENIEKFSKRTMKVTRQHSEDCKKLLRLMGVPVVEASSEAEAECAALCMSGKVYAVASEDTDSLAFGAPRFLRQLKDASLRAGRVIEFEATKILEDLNLTMDQFIDLCILCGCDYCDSIRGIGGQTALKLIRLHGSIENILENLNKERYQIPMTWPYREARHIFKEPLVLASDQLPEIKWTTADEEGLVAFLVNDNGFNHDRVAKALKKLKVAKNRSFVGRVEAFFKPMACTSFPVRQKCTPWQGAKCIMGAPGTFLKPKVFSQLCRRPKVFGHVCLPVLDLGSKHLGPFSFSKGVFCFSV